MDRVNIKKNSLTIIIATVLTIMASALCFGQNTIAIEIPQNSDGKPNLMYSLDKQKDAALQLNDLEKGCDSVEIRFWLDYSLSDIRKLIVLRYNKNKWQGAYYYVHADWKYKTLRDSITGYSHKIITPKSGWDVFVKTLFSHQALTLPDFKAISDPNIIFKDGLACNVEVATKKSYRFYSYMYSPQLAEKYWQAKEMFEILNLLGTGFNISITKLAGDKTY